MITVEDIQQAKDRIARYLQPTLLEVAPGLGTNIWLKLENTNRTHSFKVRGALNAVLSLDADSRQRGIVTASSGNHAQGVAYAAYVAGVSARILMPEHTPRRKVEGARRYGAEVVLFGKTYDETEAEGRRLEREEGLTFISAYNDPKVIAGAGTIALEILESLPDVARIVVCVSGGGLISGIALAAKSLRSDIEIIGVNAESAPAMYNVFYQTAYPQVWETLAEALSGEIETGSITIPLAQQYVDQIVMVSEDDIAAAVRWMVDDQGWMAEGGGVVGVAAIMTGKI
ncbi:MAG: threonine/serine dehydratase, partial [Chitinophagaceae bacterium]|nr:threonine/serine dehydratase [Anaerolineae bacterium]